MVLCITSTARELKIETLINFFVIHVFFVSSGNNNGESGKC